VSGAFMMVRDSFIKLLRRLKTFGTVMGRLSAISSLSTLHGLHVNEDRNENLWKFLSPNHSRHTSLIHQPASLQSHPRSGTPGNFLIPPEIPIRFFNLLKKFQVLFGLDLRRINISSVLLFVGIEKLFTSSLSG
jgi:hypothetical protein